MNAKIASRFYQLMEGMPGRLGGRLLAGVLLVLLSACSEQALYSNLSEQEANEMVAQLSMGGLSAVKQHIKGDTFSVSVPPDNFAQAVTLLKNSGLPRQRFDSLGEVFAREGFVSSPLEERARLNHALSQEIASTLSSIDGVILARVHLAVPEQDELSDTRAPASASVFVKHRSDVDLSSSVSLIKALVVNGIENLPYDNITVALFESLDSTDRSQGVADVPAASALASIGTQGIAQQGFIPDLATVPAYGAVVALTLLLVALYFAIRLLRGGRV